MRKDALEGGRHALICPTAVGVAAAAAAAAAFGVRVWPSLALRVGVEQPRPVAAQLLEAERLAHEPLARSSDAGGLVVVRTRPRELRAEVGEVLGERQQVRVGLEPAPWGWGEMEGVGVGVGLRLGSG